MSNKVINLILFLIAGTGSIAALFQYTQSGTNNANHFTRFFPSHLLGAKKQIDIVYNSYYIAGNSNGFLYLANPTSPLHMLKVPYTFDSTIAQTISNPEHYKLFAPRLTVSPNSFTIADFASYTVYGGSWDHLVLDSLKTSKAFFAELVKISKNSFIARTINKKPYGYIIEKKIANPDTIILAPQVLESQNDNLFSVDGMLVYDNQSHNLAYTYYYRNEYIILDTNLHVITRKRTIDTNNVAKVSMAFNKTDNVYKLGGPPLVVNKKTCLSNSTLFIQSALMATNENGNTFNSMSVIDIYNISTGKYAGSFYLPACEGQSVSDFTVVDKTLFVICGHYLISYQLSADF